MGRRRTGEPRVLPQKAGPQKGLMRKLPDSLGAHRGAGQGQGVRRATSLHCDLVWESASLETQVQFLTPKLCDLGQLLNLAEPQFPSQ